MLTMSTLILSESCNENIFKNDSAAAKTFYRKDPKFSDRQVWANSVWHSVGIIWPYYSEVKPHYSNFRIITAIVSVSEFLGIFGRYRIGAGGSGVPLIWVMVEQGPAVLTLGILVLVVSHSRLAYLYPFSPSLLGDDLKLQLYKNLEPVFVKHYAPNICLTLKMAKFTKCQTSRFCFYYLLKS